MGTAHNRRNLFFHYRHAYGSRQETILYIVYSHEFTRRLPHRYESGYNTGIRGMHDKMETKTKYKRIVVLGFALFAMFFGAGNVILPPMLGFTARQNWLSGFLVFIVADAGLAVLALVAASRKQDGIKSVIGVLGKVPSTILILMNAVCIGPLVAIPRTGSVTYELAVKPFFANCPTWVSWVTSIVFFLIVALLCIRPTKVVDIVGKILSPLMLAALGVLIVVGVVRGGQIPSTGVSVADSLKKGLTDGYQTMDMLGAMMFSGLTLANVSRAGFTGKKQYKAVIGAGLIAALGLFLVYGGLTYLGAATMVNLPADADRTVLLVAITEAIFGKFGMVLLGFIVACACLTTAIGLVSAISELFCSLLHCKMQVFYPVFVVASCVISCAISNVGTTTILNMAAPVLELIYPIFFVLVALSFFSAHIHSKLIYWLPSACAVLTAAYTLIDTRLLQGALHSASLPLSSVGLSWMLPAAVGLVAGLLLSLLLHKRKSKQPTTDAPSSELPDRQILQDATPSEA